jgi:hypothetical protein
MSPVGVEQEAIPHGTLRGKYGARVLLLLCQCCEARPAEVRQILAEIRQGKLTIDGKNHGERHYLVLGQDLVERLDEPRKLLCTCCDPETDRRRALAECQDGLLIIRARRYERLHFVALTGARLQRLLQQTL